MKNIVVVAFISFFSLLIANEAGLSAVDVVENASIYEGVAGVATYQQYQLLAISFWIAGMVAGLVALFLVTQRITKK
jgi:hypothetical protein